MYNRYLFYKRLYKDYVIIFNKKNKFYSFDIDSKLLDYINNKDINYIIVDCDNNVLVHECVNNKYKEYLYKLFFIDLCIRFRNNV